MVEGLGLKKKLERNSFPLQVAEMNFIVEIYVCSVRC